MLVNICSSRGRHWCFCNIDLDWLTALGPLIGWADFVVEFCIVYIYLSSRAFMFYSEDVRFFTSERYAGFYRNNFTKIAAEHFIFACREDTEAMCQIIFGWCFMFSVHIMHYVRDMWQCVLFVLHLIAFCVWACVCVQLYEFTSQCNVKCFLLSRCLDQ